MTKIAATRLPILCSSLALLIATVGCSNSPTEPSGAGNGAVIAGVVTGAQGSTSTTTGARVSAATPQAASPFAGLTIQIVGTNLSVVVGPSGEFSVAGVPSGNRRLRVIGGSVDGTIEIVNVARNQFIEIQVLVNGTTVVIGSEARSRRISLCHAEGNGSFHLIDVSESAEPAHRGHGDAMIGEPVPGHPAQIFDANCRIIGPSIDIEKFTNGEDADFAPGPSVLVGDPIVWEYRVTNTGTVSLTGVVVVDDKGVLVLCAGQAILAAGASMTCTATGVAVLGQYRNVGTVTANFTFGAISGTVTDADASHYRGITALEDEDGPKVNICHRTGNGSFHLINVSVNAEPAHRAHGDARPGELVPNQPGRRFTSNCSTTGG